MTLAMIKRAARAALMALAGLAGSGATAQAQDYAAWRITFNNACNQKTDVAVRYRDRSGEWQSQGFWGIAPGEKQTVAVASSRVFYYHAKSAAARWQSDAHEFTVDGDRIPYKMNRYEIPETSVGEYTHNLLCPGGLTGYEVRVANYCADRLRIGVRYVDADTGEWITSRAYALAPDRRGALVRTSNRKVWVHASYGNKYFAQGERKKFRFDGEEHWFFSIDLSEANSLNFCGD